MYQEYIKKLNHISNKAEEVLKNRIKTLETDLKNQNKNNIKLDVNLKQLNIDFKNLTNSFDKIKKEKEKTNNDLNSSKQTVLEKQNQITSLIKQQKETSFELNSKITELENNLNNNANSFSKKEKENNNLTTKNSKLEKDLKKIESDYNSLLQKIGKISDEKNILNTELDVLNSDNESNIKTLKRIETEKISLEKESSKLIKSNNFLKEKNTTEKSLNQTLNNKLVLKEERIRDLEIKLTNAPKEKPVWLIFISLVLLVTTIITYYWFIHSTQNADYYQREYYSLKEDYSDLKQVTDNSKEKFVFGDAEFYNLKTGTYNYSFRSDSLTYVKPRLTIYSSKKDKVKIKYTKRNNYGSLTSFGKVRFIEEEHNLEIGKNTFTIGTNWGSDKLNHWDRGWYKYSFYVNNKLIGEKHLTVK